MPDRCSAKSPLVEVGEDRTPANLLCWEQHERDGS